MPSPNAAGGPSGFRVAAMTAAKAAVPGTTARVPRNMVRAVAMPSRAWVAGVTTDTTTGMDASNPAMDGPTVSADAASVATRLPVSAARPASSRPPGAVPSSAVSGCTRSEVSGRQRISATTARGATTMLVCQAAWLSQAWVAVASRATPGTTPTRTVTGRLLVAARAA